MHRSKTLKDGTVIAIQPQAFSDKDYVHITKPEHGSFVFDIEILKELIKLFYENTTITFTDAQG